MAHEQDKLRGLPCKDGVAFPHQLLIAKTVGDSRVVEVAHQQGPDLQRGSRNNTVPDVSIMFGTIKSGALELRKVKNTVQVDSQEIIYSNRNLRKVKVASSMNPRGHKLDEGLQRMMRKGKEPIGGLHLPQAVCFHHLLPQSGAGHTCRTITLEPLLMIAGYHALQAGLVTCWHTSLLDPC